ncbi:type II toxin-antitoxin system VapC family toxin [Methylobacterium sp. NEAU 140]|uniref:type II toxin-antitoxin system VapC family toxin n=1 Tax=Methylobacterium sp. NEAU 140 TaxID=3064945 RepID=UPI002733B523|nr:type II toxin-antitoxin system VapC family toxin [Methylobacterium sp. NEAU 140]MDP4023123.1 type II toxin-antitoxin system VapC family toxin [Methylobacterium sp. NEAU 140]
MIVVDASVAVKWFLDEPSSSQARALVEEDCVRIAPEHVLAEVGQVLLKAIRARYITVDHAHEALALLRDLVQLLPTRDLADSAIEIALEIGCTNYDALYVAAAERWGATLVTADAKLQERLKLAGRTDIVRLLEA